MHTHTNAYERIKKKCVCMQLALQTHPIEYIAMHRAQLCIKVKIHTLPRKCI